MEQAAVGKNGIVAGANNPIYLTTVSQLTSARNELAGLRAQAARKTAEIDQYEAMLRRTPGVEREYSDIQRRRASLRIALNDGRSPKGAPSSTRNSSSTSRLPNRAWRGSAFGKRRNARQPRTRSAPPDGASMRSPASRANHRYCHRGGARWQFSTKNWGNSIAIARVTRRRLIPMKSWAIWVTKKIAERACC